MKEKTVGYFYDEELSACGVLTCTIVVHPACALLLG